MREGRVGPQKGRPSLQARLAHFRVARLARGAARTGKQLVSSRHTGHGDSANPKTREREHHTATYYIKTAADDVRKAMTTLENHIEEAVQIRSDTKEALDRNSNVEPATIQ